MWLKGTDEMPIPRRAGIGRWLPSPRLRSALSSLRISRLSDRTATVLALAFCAAIALLVAFATGPAFGQAAQGTTPKDTSNEKLPAVVTDPGTTSTGNGDGGSGGLVRTIVGLVVVIGVIYGITWVLKQAKASREPDEIGSGLGTAATLSLGGTRAVHLVRAGREYILLGVTDGGVQPLRIYTEAEAREAGFPVDDEDAVDELRPLGKERPAAGFAPQLVERVRDLTVRR
jgi:flagellar protein FliO/FliZ